MVPAILRAKAEQRLRDPLPSESGGTLRGVGARRLRGASELYMWENYGDGPVEMMNHPRERPVGKGCCSRENGCTGNSRNNP